MQNYTFEDFYDTLLGEVHGADAVPGVENAYADGSKCDLLYQQMWEAYERLRTRLGAIDDDPDVEVVINSLLSIQHILCKKCFHYGQLLR